MYRGKAGMRRSVFRLTSVWQLDQQNNTEHLAAEVCSMQIHVRCADPE